MRRLALAAVGITAASIFLSACASDRGSLTPTVAGPIGFPSPTPPPTPPPFELVGVSPNPVILHPGERRIVDVTVRRNAYDGPIQLQTGPDDSLVYSTGSIPAGATEGTVPIAAEADSTPSPGGFYSGVAASNGEYVAAASLVVRVFPPNDTMFFGDVRMVAMTNDTLDDAVVTPNDVVFLSEARSELAVRLQARKISDGELDGSFGVGGTTATLPVSVSGTMNLLELSSDPTGRLVTSAYAGADMHLFLVRATADGSLDTGFGSAGSEDLPDIRASVVDSHDPGGHLAILGRAPLGVSILDPDGAPDSPLGPVPIPDDVTGFGRYVPVMEDDRSVFIASGVELDRYLFGGGLDPSFGDNGRVAIDWPSSLHGGPTDGRPGSGPIGVTDDGRIVVAATWSTPDDYDGTLAIVEPDGSHATVVVDDAGNPVRIPGLTQLVPDAAGGMWILSGHILDDGEGWYFLLDHLGADGMVDQEHPTRTFRFTLRTSARAAGPWGNDLVVVIGIDNDVDAFPTTWIAWVPLY